MKALSLYLFVGASALIGCASPTRNPPELANVQLTHGDSPVVMLNKMWFEKKDGPLVVKGYVVKRVDATDTTQTHLDLTIFDASGAILRSSVEHFEPRQIPRRPRMPDQTTYKISLEPLPEGAARVDVRAHEGNHS